MPKEGVSNFGSLVRSQDDDGEDETTEDGVLFYVNKGGFPIDDFTWDRMWHHVAKLHPDSYNMVNKIKRKSSLPEVQIPVPPLNFPPTSTTDEKLAAVQKYMSDLQYNHTGTQFYEIRKNRPISGLLDTAKEMIREALPIKCLEAVILALLLTNGIMGLDRFPISFKTVFGGQTYRHVVLGVYSNGQYGALGMSRRDDLMYKPLTFKSLSSLVFNFKCAYERYFHNVKKMKVGMPIPHDTHSYETIAWKKLTCTVGKQALGEMARDIDRHGREMRSQRSSTVGELVSPRQSKSLDTKTHKPRKPKSAGVRKKAKKKVLKAVSSDHRKEDTEEEEEEEEGEDNDDEEEEEDKIEELPSKTPLNNYHIRV